MRLGTILLEHNTKICVVYPKSDLIAIISKSASIGRWNL